MKMIDKDALLAEIERKKDRITFLNEFANGTKFGLQTAIDIIDTLEVKEVDLEKELKYYCHDYYNCDYPKQLEEENCSEVMPHIVSAAKHFFKLGLKAQKGEEV